MKRNLHAGKKLSGGFCLEPFTDDELDEIHLATLEVMEKTGVYVEDPEAREIFHGAGATVDEKKSIVKIPPYVVEDATFLSKTDGSIDLRHAVQMATLYAALKDFYLFKDIKTKP